MIEIEIKGLSEALARLSPSAVQAALGDSMQRAVFRLQARMSDYPPKPPRSTYRRTGTLGRRWTTRINRSPGELVGTVGNVTSYGPFVQSEQFQRPFHKRAGWITDSMAADQEEAAIVADFEQAIQEVLR